MRSLIYTVSVKTVPVFETFSYQTAMEYKNQGYNVISRFNGLRDVPPKKKRIWPADLRNWREQPKSQGKKFP